MLEALGPRELIIHVDDCQLFFPDVVISHTFDSSVIVAHESMALALHAFTTAVSKVRTSQSVVWIFSGARPTLVSQIRLSSCVLSVDVSKHLDDFRSEEIVQVLSNYFSLADLDQEQKDRLAKLSENLEGPPKILQFFLEAAAMAQLLHVQDLFDQWESIETRVINKFKRDIPDFLGENLDVSARYLALIHVTSLVACGSGAVNVQTISPHFLQLIEAGLLRVHEDKDNGLKMFPPHRFPLRIFSDYVQWYTWENISH